MQLVGDTALVTGGGRGIGKAITAELLSRGARVTVLEVEPEHASQAQDELGAYSERLAFSIGSVAVAADVDAAFALAHERFGAVSMLVNNAGTAALSLVVDMAEADWDLIVDTCMKGTFLCTRGVPAVRPGRAHHRAHRPGRRGTHVRGLFSYWDAAVAESLV